MAAFVSQPGPKKLGFGKVGNIILIIVLAVALSAAVYVLHKTPKTSSVSSTTASTATQNYLTIKQWGAKLPLTSVDAGAYYTYNTSNANNMVDVVRVFNTHIDALKNANGASCKAANYPLFVMTRIKQSNLATVLNPKSQNYIGTLLPSGFNMYSFSSQFMFAGGTLQHQASPPCLFLDAKYTKVDPNIQARYTAVWKALSDSYTKMQAQ